MQYSEQQEHTLRSLLATLNTSAHYDNVLREIVRACKEENNLVKARLFVLENLSKKKTAFCERIEDVADLNWCGSDTVLAHECGMIHIPAIMPSPGIPADSMCEFARFIASRGGEVNAFASQRFLSTVSHIQEEPQNVRNEHTEKTAIFYAIEKGCPSLLNTLIDLGADCDFGMRDVYSVNDRTTAVMYAIDTIVKDTEQRIEYFEILDMLLGATGGVDSLLSFISKNWAAKSSVVEFVTIMDLNLELLPEKLAEVLKGEYLSVIELLLKSKRALGSELEEIKKLEKYRNMRGSRLTKKQCLSASAVPVRAASLTNVSIRCASSLPDVSNPSVAKKNAIITGTAEGMEEQLLSLAICHSRIGVVRWLLKNECVDVDRRNGYGFAPIHFAAAANSVQAIELLLDAGASVNERRVPFTNAAHIAALNGSLDVLRFLGERYPEALSAVDCNGQNVLHYAVGCGDSKNLEIVKYIIRNVKELDPDARIDSELGRKLVAERIETLRERGYSTGSDAENSRALELIGERSQILNGFTALHIAVECGNFAIAKFLIEEAKCDPNIVSPDGFTALSISGNSGNLLHLAAHAKDAEFFKKLLTYKDVDLGARCKGRAPMDIAIANRDRAIINLLLSDNRQDLITLRGSQEIHYVRVLNALRLLNSEGRQILLNRIREGRALSSGTIAKLAASFGVVTLLLVSVAAMALMNKVSHFQSLGIYVPPWHIMLLMGYSAIFAVCIAIGVLSVIREWLYCKEQMFLLSESSVKHKELDALGYYGRGYSRPSSSLERVTTSRSVSRSGSGSREESGTGTGSGENSYFADSELMEGNAAAGLAGIHLLPDGRAPALHRAR